MPDRLTVKEAADRLGVHPNTIRTWTGDFADHLSELAAPAPGQTRYFGEEDLLVFWTIQVLRAEGKDTDEINEELAAGTRLEPIEEKVQEEGEEDPAGEEPGRGGPRDTAAMALELVRGQVESLQNERDYLRDQLETEREARLEAVERAVKAETELQILRGQGGQQNALEGDSRASEGKTEAADESRPWWKFWR